MKQAWLAWGAFCFRFRNFLFPAVLVMLLVFFRPHPFLGTAHGDVFLDAAGLLVGFMGQVLRALVVGLAYIRRGGKNKKVYADTLVTEGMFKVMRNPLYVANLLGIAGMLLIYHNIWVYVLGGGFFLTAYSAIVANEETFLLQKFGDAYRDYCREVPRWWPKLSRIKEASEGLSFRWKRVVAKEYATFFSGLSATIAVLAYDTYWTAPRAYWAEAWITLGLLWLALVALTAWLWQLKHRGVFQEKKVTLPADFN